MRAENEFQFVRNEQLKNITVLQAAMNDFAYDKHAHEEYSFGLTLSGRQDFFTGGAFYRSLPGQIIIFNPGEVHDGHSGIDETLRYRMIYIHPEEMEPMLESAGIRQARDFQIQGTLLQDDLLRQRLTNLARLVNQRGSNKLEIECELYQLAARIAQRCGQFEASQLRQRKDRLLLQAKDYIHAHLREELTLNNISEAANLSKYHFLRLFRSQFGITPHQYIVNCRINQARKALETGTSVDDLVAELGFSDVSHFNRRFKPIYGMTPRQYQQSITT